MGSASPSSHGRVRHVELWALSQTMLDFLRLALLVPNSLESSHRFGSRRLRPGREQSWALLLGAAAQIDGSAELCICAYSHSSPLVNDESLLG